MDMQEPELVQFGLDVLDCENFEECDALWWEPIEQEERDRIDQEEGEWVYRLAEPIPLEKVMYQGRVAETSSSPEVFFWLKNCFAWQAFDYRQEQYVNKVGLLQGDPSGFIRPVIWTNIKL